MDRLRRTLLAGAIGLGGLIAATIAANAQDVTLRLHQFLPAQANVPKLVLDEWIKKVEAASNGKALAAEAQALMRQYSHSN